MTLTLPFPVQIARTIPRPFNTADLQGVAVGRDGFEYAIKSIEDHPYLPASEWFCYNLGYRLQIALPPFCILEGGPTEAFGSRFEGGVFQFANVTGNQNQHALLQRCGSDLSKILAFDLFVGNDDRHLNNFLYRQQQVGGQLTVLAMDFSRSLLVNKWPDDPVPMATSTKTMTVMGILKNFNIWDATVAQMTLASIHSVSRTEVAHWLAAMPAAWLEPVKRQEIVEWWGSEKFDQRVSECKKLV